MIHWGRREILLLSVPGFSGDSPASLTWYPWRWGVPWDYGANGTNGSIFKSLGSLSYKKLNLEESRSNTPRNHSHKVGVRGPEWLIDWFIYSWISTWLWKSMYLFLHTHFFGFHNTYLDSINPCTYSCTHTFLDSITFHNTYLDSINPCTYSCTHTFLNSITPRVLRKVRWRTENT